MKITYIAETSLSNKSAYTLHVLKMCDAFLKKGQVQLILPYITKDLKLNSIKKNFLLTSKKKLIVKGILKHKIKNFLSRIYFGYKSAKYIKNFNCKIILTRSIISSFFLCVFKVKHFLEIHNELKGLTKFLMINLNFINSQYVVKTIFISKTLITYFQSINKNKILVLHDAVNIKNFNYKKNDNKIKNLAYIGSFYKGKGIELILQLAKKFKKLNFNIYGDLSNKFYKSTKNVKFHGYINYKEVPRVLSNSDLLLLPSANTQYGRLYGVNIANYNSPLKMFDYLAAGKIIVASKRDGICEILKHNFNSIVVDKYVLEDWVLTMKNILNKNYNLKKIRKNSIKTAKNNTWDKRVKKILKHSNF